MSRSDARDWKDAADRLKLEKTELAREAERQRLLDDLSTSTQRNHDLESAMARLTREQDRLVLLEQERIFKRAQVAQATAALVHEANWAKNRMENEMKLAKQRSQLFPETVIPGSVSIPPMRNSTVPDIRPLKLLKSPEIHISSKPSTSTPSKRSQSSTPSVLPTAPSVLPTISPIDALPAKPASGVATPVVISAEALVASLQSAYTNVLGSLFSDSDAPSDGKAGVLPTSLSIGGSPLVGSTSAMPSSGAAGLTSTALPSESTVAAELVPSDGAPPEIKPFDVPLGVVRLHAEPVGQIGGVKGVSFRPAPAVALPPTVKRAVHRGGKGEWTSQEIYDEAAQRMTAEVVERIDLLQNQRLRMTKLFGLVQPVPSIPAAVRVDSIVESLEAEWISQIQKGGLQFAPTEAPPEIDPAIAAAIIGEPAAPAETVPEDESPKKKNKCIIM